MEGQEPQINVVDSSGQVGSIPESQFDQEAMDQGFKPATSEDLSKYQNEQTYGTPTEQLKTAAEGALSAATFGAGPAIESKLGVPLKNIRARAETNPLSRQAGEVAGLVGEEFIPGLQEVGAQRLMGRAGEMGAEALGLGGVGALSKVGSSAVKAAIENTIFQGGEEVSKMLYGDPNQSAQTAAIDIGLGGLLGGGVGAAFGTISPLWKATTGEKLGGFLNAIQKRADGESIALPKSLQEAVDMSGLDVPPEIRTAISGDPELARQYNMLRETGTKPGVNTREALSNFTKQATDQVIESVGKNPSAIEGLENLSENAIGTQIKDQLTKDLKERIGPLAEQFEARKEQFKGTELSNQQKDKLANDIASLISKEGLDKFPDEEAAKITNRFLGYIPKLKTIEDLGKASTQINAATKDPALWRIGRQLRSVFRDAEDDMTSQAMADKAPKMIEQHQAVRQAYGAAKQVMEDLDDRLHVGNYAGPESFYKAVKDMDPEDVLRRLNPEKRADIIPFLGENFPKVSEQLREYHLDNALRNASRKAPEGYPIKTQTLFDHMEKLSPEMRDFVYSKEAQKKISAVRTVLDAIPKHQTSGTARNLDNMWSKLPGGAMAMASMLTGHNPAVGFMLGQASKWAMRDAPDAMRLGLLKFLGHSGPVDPPAFKAMVDYMAATIKGESTLSRGVKGIFKAGQEIVPQSQMPTEKETEKLDKKLQSIKDNPNSLFEQGSTSYYLPDHGQAIAATQARAVQYLNSLRPSTDKMAILGKDRIPSKAEMSKYNRALSVAEAPMVVLQHVKDGTIVPQDIVTLKTIYPGLYDRTSQKMFNEIAEMDSKDRSLPYKTKFGLSMFLGTPLDASMTPFAINQSQLAHQAQQAQNQQEQANQGGHKTGSPKALEKLSGMYKTGAQSRDAQRASKA